jgi:hypothetical protein
MLLAFTEVVVFGNMYTAAEQFTEGLAASVTASARRKIHPEQAEPRARQVSCVMRSRDPLHLSVWSGAHEPVQVLVRSMTIYGETAPMSMHSTFVDIIVEAIHSHMSILEWMRNSGAAKQRLNLPDG